MAGKPSAHAALARPIAATVPVLVLITLMLSKSAYTSSLSNYLTFYFIDKFQLTVQASQVLLFVFLVFRPGGLFAPKGGRD